MENLKKYSFNVGEAKKIVADLFQPNPWIYWSDFLGSAALGYFCFYLVATGEASGAWKYLFFFISVFALYRALLFTHEITHRDRKELPFFSIAWNLIIGVPFLIPSFMYRGVHIDHHKRNLYGTHEDGEYLPMGASTLWMAVGYIAQSFIIPISVYVRFFVLTPLSFLHPKFRRYTMRRLSAMAIRFDVDRSIPEGIDLRNWYVQEALCFLYTIPLTYFVYEGILPFSVVIQFYLTVVVIALFNALRTIVAHRYRNKSGRELAFEEQIADSVNIENNPILSELFAPVGLRYHGLHHFFASMPYHNLYEAHRRLKAGLPADSVYHLMSESSFLTAMGTLVENSRQGRAINAPLEVTK